VSRREALLAREVHRPTVPVRAHAGRAECARPLTLQVRNGVAHHAGITEFVGEFCQLHVHEPPYRPSVTDPFDLLAPAPMAKGGTARLTRLDIAGCRCVDQWGLESLSHLMLEELHVPSTCTDHTVRSIARSSS
jgi:hypothetical protein